MRVFCIKILRLNQVFSTKLNTTSTLNIRIIINTRNSVTFSNVTEFHTFLQCCKVTPGMSSVHYAASDTEHNAPALMHVLKHKADWTGAYFKQSDTTKCYLTQQPSISICCQDVSLSPARWPAQHIYSDTRWQLCSSFHSISVSKKIAFSVIYI